MIYRSSVLPDPPPGPIKKVIAQKYRAAFLSVETPVSILGLPDF
jgi:hypothetical protein